MFKLKLISIATLLLLAGCQNEKVEQTPSSQRSVILVNVLDDKLFHDAHIKGSINVQLNEIEKASHAWNKDATIVIYCSNYMCTASSQAARQLQELGFKDVRVYEGGTAQWYQLNKKDSSYELVGPAQEAYLSIALEKPTDHSSDITEINAQELKKLLKEANILS